MTEDEKQEFYKSEYHGAPLTKHVTFRCTEVLWRFIKIKEMEEGRDMSAVIRRLVSIAATQEGYNKDGI